MASILEVEWGSCLLERRPDSAVEKQIRRSSGHVPGAIAYFTPVPWMVHATAVLNARLLTRTYLDHDLADLVGLVVSQDSSCRFCFAATRGLLLVLGYPRSRIAQLEQGLIAADLPPPQRTALEFARRLARANPPPSPADIEPLRRAGFDDKLIRELAGLTALHVFFTRVSTLPALPPYLMEQLPDRWPVRLLRPLIDPWMRRLRRRGPAEHLQDAEKEGIYSSIVLALDGLPLARELRRALDNMWQSTILPRRAKALVFAVVARALGCGPSEREAVRLALKEGLPSDQVDVVLAHLAAPALDDVERLIVPFARETVWYQTPQIQRRARDLSTHLTKEQFIELTGVAGLANAVCRLASVLATR